MPRAKCGKSTERTVDFYLTECSLPYVDASQLAGAAQEGRTVREGLVSRDRADLIARRIRPALERLYPRDPERVDEECRRLGR